LNHFLAIDAGRMVAFEKPRFIFMIFVKLVLLLSFILCHVLVVLVVNLLLVELILLIALELLLGH